MSRLVIAGAGAAGLFAAGTALAAGHKVTLVEHMDAPGRKLLITGKGRCNLTNACTVDEFLKAVRHNPRFLYSALSELPPAAVMEFFEGPLGLPLVTERGRRVFPQSGDARDVLAALLRFSAGADMIKGEAQSVAAENGHAAGLRLASGQTVAGDAVLIATGGLSYQNTGSRGAGYEMARAVGHRVVPTGPSLVAMVEQGGFAKKMAGLSLRNVQLALLQDGKRVFAEQGEMLFTHFGVSGPLVLSASAFLGDFAKHAYTLEIDLKPALSPEKLDARILRDFAEMPNKDAANALDKLLPASMRAPMCERWGVEAKRKVNQITKLERQKLAALLKRLEIPIAGKGDLAHAVITQGGVDVKEVAPKTMQSKLLPGLFFAGEVLDVDAETGGYNLQIAWATAHAAASHCFE